MQTEKPNVRTVAIVAAALFAAATPIVQTLMGVIAVGRGDLANDGNQTLEAAGYAFSIWGVIYLGLLAYAGYQALPSTKETPGLQMLGWPSVIAMAGCGVWLLAASADAKWATVGIICVSALALCLALLKRYPVQHRIEFWLIAAPLSLLAGWLTVASAINLLTVLTSYEVIRPETAAAWGGGGILTVMAIGLGISLTAKNWVYPLPIAWGLAAVAVAEQADRPTIALLAGGAAVVLAATAAWVGSHKAILLPYPRQQ
ncbi:MAG: hypothetical protein ABMA14_06865 [Hyphomonadaceae bacterium]